MQNGQKTMMNTHHPKSARPFFNRSKQWTSNVARPEPRGSGNAQRNYERVSRASPIPSPVRRYSRGRKLLPARVPAGVGWRIPVTEVLRSRCPRCKTCIGFTQPRYYL
jgi:hypothetical protein